MLGFIVHRSFVAGNSFAVTTSQTTQQSIFMTRAVVFVTLAVAVAFYRFQQICCSGNLSTFWLCGVAWIKIIAQPGLNLVVHSVAVVYGCITGGWERFRREIHRSESHLAAEPRCSFKVKIMSRLTLYTISSNHLPYAVLSGHSVVSCVCV